MEVIESKHFKPTYIHTWDSEADSDRTSVVVSFPKGYILLNITL